MRIDDCPGGTANELQFTLQDLDTNIADIASQLLRADTGLAQSGVGTTDNIAGEIGDLQVDRCVIVIQLQDLVGGNTDVAIAGQISQQQIGGCAADIGGIGIDRQTAIDNDTLIVVCHPVCISVYIVFINQGQTGIGMQGGRRTDGRQDARRDKDVIRGGIDIPCTSTINSGLVVNLCIDTILGGRSGNFKIVVPKLVVDPAPAGGIHDDRSVAGHRQDCAKTATIPVISSINEIRRMRDTGVRGPQLNIEDTIQRGLGVAQRPGGAQGGIVIIRQHQRAVGSKIKRTAGIGVDDQFVPGGEPGIPIVDLED